MQTDKGKTREKKKRNGELSSLLVGEIIHPVDVRQKEKKN